MVLRRWTRVIEGIASVMHKTETMMQNEQAPKTTQTGGSHIPAPRPNIARMPESMCCGITMFMWSLKGHTNANGYRRSAQGQAATPTFLVM